MKAFRASFWRQLTILANMASVSAGGKECLVSESLQKSVSTSAGSETTNNAENPKCLRLNSVIGDGDKENDLLFCGNLATGKEHVVYFGGDVQDFRENMLSHRDNHRHVRWCLEETATLLHRRFPEGNIWVVKPSAMYLKTLSVFCNFVETDGIGTPTFSENHGAMQHLIALLSNGMQLIKKLSSVDTRLMTSKENEANKDDGQDEVVRFTASFDKIQESQPDSLPVRLIGFSKGSVVLNQLLHEVHLVDKEEPIKNAFSRVTAFYWLDGGHAGNLNTWITDVSVLKNLRKINADLHVHVTPYQMEDSMRPWIAKEEKKFVSRLRSLGLNVIETKHFEGEDRSIEIHFLVLESF
ncbi:mitochondrial protein C2orf69 homolog [Liolophura sinensis]|uniref:mitochondrial protein C2orf69 homolog n=1 Tax=Liolophura sinensis TaxID=3198878 RepID=UPI0031598645